MWKDHFKELLNCIKKYGNCSKSSQLADDPRLIIKADEIEFAIHKLATGKSCSLDGVYAEHLKYSSNGYKILLAECLTSFLRHGFLPESLMSVVLVPIIKDKSGQINSIDNYRLMKSYCRQKLYTDT